MWLALRSWLQGVQLQSSPRPSLGLSRDVHWIWHRCRIGSVQCAVRDRHVCLLHTGALCPSQAHLVAPREGLRVLHSYLSTLIIFMWDGIAFTLEGTRAQYAMGKGEGGGRGGRGQAARGRSKVVSRVGAGVATHFCSLVQFGWLVPRLPPPPHPPTPHPHTLTHAPSFTK